jgi:DNA-binding response OmpR family regulator
MTAARAKSDGKVLVLDDEPDIRESLAEFLGDCGFDVLTAESGEKALDLPLLGKVVVAVVDIRLGGMDGMEFIRRMHERVPGASCLIHTGSTDFQLDDGLRAIGVADHDIFFKPVVDMRIFESAIRKKMAEAGS